jgi:diguanylate cyclase (GGDEF)-like protein
VTAFDFWEWLAGAAVDLPLILTFVFGAVAAIAIAWALWIRRTMAREAELLQLLQERTEQLEGANERLRNLSLADALTGVANRRAFDQSLDSEWRRAVRSKQPLSLLMLDIDNFKSFNDAYGHQSGDKCLAAVASELGRVPRRAADRVARYGGEEFAALLPLTDTPGALALAERMRAAVEGLNIPHTGGVDGRVTISIGCATAESTDGITADMLVAAADAALYDAKRSGRNRKASARVESARTGGPRR